MHSQFRQEEQHAHQIIIRGQGKANARVTGDRIAEVVAVLVNMVDQEKLSSLCQGLLHLGRTPCGWNLAKRILLNGDGMLT